MADENVQANANEQGQSQEIEIKTETGQVFKGTKDQIIADMKKSVESGSTTIRQYKEANEQLTKVAESLAPKVEERQPEPGSFDSQRYFKLLAEDPPAAFRMQHEVTYGETPEETLGKLASAYQRSVEIGGLMEVQKFINMVKDEYPGTTEVAEMIWKYGGFDHNPATAASMLAAYTELKQAGRIKPASKALGEPEKKEPRRQAPQSARGTGSHEGLTASEQSRYGKMTTDQIKQEMDKIRGSIVQ